MSLFLSDCQSSLYVCLSSLLTEKHTELGDQVTKLRNGLLKISDTREKVEAMSVELEKSKKQVAEFQKECDQYLTVILQQQQEGAEKQKVNVVNLYLIKFGSRSCSCLTEKKPIAFTETFMFICVQIVNAHSEKIAAEELECKAMAETAQSELDKALPALQEALKVNLSPVDYSNPYLKLCF